MQPGMLKRFAHVALAYSQMPHEQSTDPLPSGSPHIAETSSLTPRELEIAELISEGLSNEQIARRLVLTTGTVANHVAHILAKLGVHSRVQVAVNVALRKHEQQSQRVLALLG